MRRWKCWSSNVPRGVPSRSARSRRSMFAGNRPSERDVEDQPAFAVGRNLSVKVWTMIESHDFTGKTALVTGAGSGIGAATAVALGRAGASVGVHCRRSRAGAEAAAAQIRKAGSEALVVQADLSLAGEVERMFEEMVLHFGTIHMLVNNAGDWMDKSPIADCPEDQWDHMMNANAKSVFLCSRRAIPLMKALGEGTIVNLGSVAGHTGGGGGTVPYAAAKAAVHTFTRGLARELGPDGIRVNAVAPGMVDTPMLEGRVTEQASAALQAMTPLGRMARPEEIARVVLMLLSPAASFVTGEIVEVNGGLLMR